MKPEPKKRKAAEAPVAAKPASKPKAKAKAAKVEKARTEPLRRSARLIGKKR